MAEDVLKKISLRQTLIPVVWIVCLVLLVYIPSLKNDFVSDDRAITLLPARTLTAIFSPPLLLTRSLVIFGTYIFFGVSPFFFRLGNIFLHIANTILIYLLLCRLTTRTRALFSATIFAIHPISVESVAWISGGAYPLAAFFFLCSFLLYLYARRKLVFQILSIISFILSLFSLLSAWTMFLLFWVYELCFGSIKKQWHILLVYTIASMLYVGLLIYTNSFHKRLTFVRQDYFNTASFVHPVQSIPPFIVGYIKLMLWPKALALFHPDIVAAKTPTATNWTIFLALCIGTLAIYRKNRLIFFWIAFTFIPVLPYLSPVRFSDLFTERYVYLSSMGLIVIIVTIISSAIHHVWDNVSGTIVVYLCIAFVSIPLYLRTRLRIQDWQHEQTFWIATAQAQPMSPNARLNAGEAYWQMNKLDYARREFESVATIVPVFPDAYFDLAVTFGETNQMEYATNAYRLALTYNPNLWQSHLNLTENYSDANRLQRVLDGLERYILSLPVDPMAQHLLEDLRKERRKIQ